MTPDNHVFNLRSVTTPATDMRYLRQALLIWVGLLSLYLVLLQSNFPPATGNEFILLQLGSKLPPALALFLGSYSAFLKHHFHPALFCAVLLMTLPDIFSIAYLWQATAYALSFDNITVQILLTLFIFGLSFKYVAWYIGICIMSFGIVLANYPVYGAENLFKFTSALMICTVILLGRLHIHIAFERATDTNTRLLDISLHDNLTQLLHRIPFTHGFEKLIATAKNAPMPVAVFMIDVDDFKHYNDSYGHPAGDVLLTEVAQAIKHVLRREGDIIGRLGGDEYAAATSNISRDLACEMAERLLVTIRLIGTQNDLGPATADVSISIGMYWGTPKTHETSQSLIKKADEALYQAKSAGRNCYRLYSERNNTSIN